MDEMDEMDLVDGVDRRWWSTKSISSIASISSTVERVLLRPFPTQVDGTVTKIVFGVLRD